MLRLVILASILATLIGVCGSPTDTGDGRGPSGASTRSTTIGKGRVTPTPYPTDPAKRLDRTLELALTPGFRPTPVRVPGHTPVSSSVLASFTARGGGYVRDRTLTVYENGHAELLDRVAGDHVIANFQLSRAQLDEVRALFRRPEWRQAETSYCCDLDSEVLHGGYYIVSSGGKSVDFGDGTPHPRVLDEALSLGVRLGLLARGTPVPGTP